MGELKVKVNEKTEQMFREAAMHEFGFHKGAFSRAADQALARWAERHHAVDTLRARAKQKIKNPVNAMTGILKETKGDAVGLKHEIARIRAARWNKHVH